MKSRWLYIEFGILGIVAAVIANSGYSLISKSSIETTSARSLASENVVLIDECLAIGTDTLPLIKTALNKVKIRIQFCNKTINDDKRLSLFQVDTKTSFKLKLDPHHHFTESSVIKLIPGPNRFLFKDAGNGEDTESTASQTSFTLLKN